MTDQNEEIVVNEPATLTIIMGAPTRNFVDEDGCWVGGFSGEEPPEGSHEVPTAPSHASQVWDFGTETWGSPPEPVKEWANVRLFLDEFTREERIAVRRLAKDDEIVDDFWTRLLASQVIQADDETLLQGLAYVVANGNGALTQARVNEVLGL